MNDKLINRLSRNTDPVTSHLAALDLVDSGDHEKQSSLVLRALKENPGVTSQELAVLMGHRYYWRQVTSRRLPDLEKKGHAMRLPTRKCDISNRLSLTWEAM